jgi:hypothetical protein
MAPLVVLLSGAIPDADPVLLSLATTIGVLAAAVRFLGLVRWPFLVPGWLDGAGIAVGPVLMVCALEFVGGHERDGSKVAERLTPLAYVAWSLWLAATGVGLLA